MSQSLSNKQALYVVKDFMKYLVKDNVLQEIKVIIRDAQTNNNISTIGVQQVTKLIFPELMQQVDAQQLGSNQNQIHANNIQFNPINNTEIAYRKQCDDMKFHRQNRSLQSLNQNVQWLKHYAQNKNDIEEFHKKLNLQSSVKQNKLNNNKKCLRVVIKACPPVKNTLRTAKGKQREHQNNNNLIKLGLQVQQGDSESTKQRQIYHKKKEIQKQFQKAFLQTKKQQMKDSQQSIKNSISTQIQPLEYTTDYNGQFIEFSIKKDKQLPILRSHKLSKYNQPNKNHRNVHDSHQGQYKLRQNQLKVKFSDQNMNAASFHDDSIKPKTKTKFRVYKQNFIQPYVEAITQKIRFQVVPKQIQKESSQSSLYQNKTHGKKPVLYGKVNQTKQSKQFAPLCGNSSILKSFRLSPGVSFDNFLPGQTNDKQNEFQNKMPTKKPVVKSSKKLVKFYNDPTLKSICLSKRCIKRMNSNKKHNPQEFSSIHQIKF